MPRLVLHLLGYPRIELDGAPVTFDRKKAVALLVYLALEPRPHHRERLAALFEPSGSAARTSTSSINNPLSSLYQAIGEQWFSKDRTTIQLTPSSGDELWVDVQQFRSLLADCRYHGHPAQDVCPRCISNLEQAVALYTDDFLGGFAPDGADFQAWQRDERENLHVALADAREKLERAVSGQRRTPTGQNLGVRISWQPGFLEVQEASLAVERSDPFVAREGQLTQLHQLLHDALTQGGRVAFVTGEAGSGKTSLVHHFAREAQVAQPKLVVAFGMCNLYTGIGDPYLPFRDLLGMLTGEVEALWEARAITTSHARRLWQLLPQSVTALLDHGPHLIDTFVDGRALARHSAAYTNQPTEWCTRLDTFLTHKTSSAEREEPNQSRLFEEFAAVLQALAAHQPLLLVLDDLHWSDPSSAALLFHLGRQIMRHPVLMVGVYRPEEVAQTSDGKPHPLSGIVSEFKRLFGDTVVNLDQIAQAEERRFVDALLDKEPNGLKETIRQELVRHGRGHPLFTTELVEEMKARGYLIQDAHGRWMEGAALDWRALPARVEGVIESRIERLDPMLRNVLSVASVEGEIFTAEAIARVQSVSAQQLVQQLSTELAKRHRLVLSHGSRRLDLQLLTQYRFRHVLFQHYLYHQLDATERVYLHEAVGNVLEQLYAAHTDEIAGQLARHFREAQLVDKAVTYLQQAGGRAVRLSANEEAIAYFTEALALLSALPDPRKRQQMELALQIGLGKVLMTVRGYADRAAEVAFVRAQELCQQLDESAQLPIVLAGLRAGYLARGELQTARDLGEQGLSIAQATQDLRLLLAAHEGLGVTYTHLGNFLLSKLHLEQGIALYNRNKRQVHRALPDPGVDCLGYASWVLWMLGYPQQALERSQQALALADELVHPHSQAVAHFFAAVLYHFRRETEETLNHARQAIAVADEHEFSQWAAHARVMQGWALAQQGYNEQAIAEIQQGLDSLQKTWGDLARAHYLSLLAEIYGKRGEPQRGLNLLIEAMTVADRCGEHWSQAELLRRKGELLRGQGAPVQEIERCFRNAHEIARLQMAKSLELRAAMCLSRLWQQEGRVKDARAFLSEIYQGFSEGQDTVDLSEAQLLLSELGSADAVGQNAGG